MFIDIIDGFKPKQSFENIRKLAENYQTAFAAEAGETGALVIPKKKLVICSIAKAGCTTIKWVALTLLGYEKYVVCDSYVHNSTLFTTKGGYMVRKESPPLYSNVFTLSSDTDWNVAKYFRDPSWTTIAFVRDPWYRSISMYLDQLKRRHALPHREQFQPTSKENFTTFISHHYRDMRHHTGQAYKFCGMDYVRYDYYVDIEDMKTGFQRVFEKRPDLIPVITQGWANCTVHHSESLLESQSDTKHQNKDFGNSVAAKKNKYDETLCSNSTVDLVFDRFKEDYAIYSRWAPELNFTKHICQISSSGTL